MTSETIYVSKEAYRALNDMSCRQKGCKEFYFGAV